MGHRANSGAIVNAGSHSTVMTAGELGLIPQVFGPHPRVFCTSADIERVRKWAHEVDWVEDRLRKLREAVLIPFEFPANLGTGPDARGVVQKAVVRIREMGLLAAIDGNAELLGRARGLAVQMARAYLALPIKGIDNKVAGGSLGESHTAVGTAQMYDLLDPQSLGEEDRFVLRAMLREMVQVLDRSPHRTCGNHNTWTLTGRIAIGAALGDADVIRGALDGIPAMPLPQSPDTPDFRYGLLHQIGHDFLADGFHWERTCGYHMYTYLAAAECAYVLGNLGIDLWRAPVPAVTESAGFDLHRAYGPPGVRRLADALHGIIHCAYASGRFPFLHDGHIEDWSELNIWGPLMARGYDATQDPVVAWALSKIAGEGPYQPPAVMRTGYEMEFVRVRHKALGPVQSPWEKDGVFAASGEVMGGNSLFPVAGHAVLRDKGGASVFSYWGPHSAGHQSPCALHMDIDTPHRRGTGTVDVNGYADPKHLTWLRSTIAHNTVTVDGKPMFPFDVPTKSAWEADSWRRRTSDGELVLFQHEKGSFSALRAVNELVYPGVKLDRTVILTGGFVIDAFRVFSDEHHVYDWAMHVIGEPDVEGQGEPVDLGEQVGYRHLTDARQLAELPVNANRTITWTELHSPLHANLVMEDGTTTILAKKALDGHGRMGLPYGSTPHRSALILRKAATRALFLSVWSWHGKPAVISGHQLRSDKLTVTVEDEAGVSKWEVPVQYGRVIRE
jgi:hypothetical protein